MVMTHVLLLALARPSLLAPPSSTTMCSTHTFPRVPKHHVYLWAKRLLPSSTRSLNVGLGCQRKQRLSSHCINLSSSMQLPTQMEIGWRRKIRMCRRLKLLLRVKLTSVKRSSTMKFTTACASPWQKVFWPRTHASSMRAGVGTWSWAETSCFQPVALKSTIVACTEITYIAIVSTTENIISSVLI